MSTKKELYQLYFDWSTDARERAPGIPVPEPMDFARYTSNEDLDQDPSYPALMTWAPVLRQLRRLHQAGELRSGKDLPDSFFDPTQAPTVDVPPEPAPPAPPPAPADPEPAPSPQLSHFVSSDFADIDLWELPTDPVPLGRVTFAERDEGRDLSWQLDQAEDSVHLYRVYSSDSGTPDVQREDQIRMMSDATAFADDQPLRTAARHYEVWVNSGDSVEEALATQPRLVGSTVYIAPVELSGLTYDSVNISGQWPDLEGTEKVEVYYSLAPDTRLDSSQNEINTGSNNRSGFRYTPQERGYTYRIGAKRYVKVGSELHGSALSVEQQLPIPAELETITADIEQLSNQELRVSWPTPESGLVRVYRTQQPPEPGAEEEPSLELASLDRYGLASKDWMNNLDSQVNSYDVVWPEGWYSLYITVVSVVGEEARIGTIAPFVRVGEVENPRLHERVEEQLISFGWPRDAAEVKAYIGEVNGAHETQRPEGSRVGTVRRENYKHTGGLSLSLKSDGYSAPPQSIALYPVRYHSGKEVVGTPAVLHYPGLETFSYDLVLEGSALFLLLRAHQPLSGPRTFVLVHRPGRLPLESTDGAMVPLRLPEHENSEQTVITLQEQNAQQPRRWQVDPQLLRSAILGEDYLRLFLLDTAEHGRAGTPSALLDPEPEKLSLQAFAQPISPEPVEPPPVDDPAAEPQKQGFWARLFGK